MQMKQQPSPVTRIRGLDGLRGIAAFTVILHHSAIKGTDIGGLSVFMFFILSGYLITGILHRSRLKVEAGIGSIGKYLKDFWLQRALRIFPAYYLWLAVFLLLDPIYFGGKTLQDWPWYVLYIQNFSIGFFRDSWIEFSHTWSLAVEQQYYVFFAPLILLLPTRLHVRFLWATIALCSLISVALSLAHFGGIAYYVAPSNGFIFMATGALIAIERPTRIPLLSDRSGLILALVLLVVLALYPVLSRAGYVHLPYLVISLTSAFTLAIIMIWVLNNGNSAVVQVLESRPFTYLGLVSYGLYIVHLPVGFLVEHFVALDVLGARFGMSGDLMEFFLVFPASMLLATASYFLFEKKFLDLKARLKG